MLLAKTLTRDWRKLAVVAFALFVVGMSVPSLLVSSQGSALAIVFSSADYLQPLIEVYYSPSILGSQRGPAYGLFENATALLLDVYRNLSTVTVEDERGAVEAWGAGLAAPAFTYYRVMPLDKCDKIVERASPGGEGTVVVEEPMVTMTELEAPEAPVVRGRGGEEAFTLEEARSPTVWITEEREAENITIRYMCGLYTRTFAVYAILSYTGKAPFKVVEGRPPNPGGDPIEVMVLDRLASVLDWSVGGTYDFLGARVKVVGLYSYTSGLAKVETPGIVVNGYSDFKRLMEALGRTAASYKPYRGEWLASLSVRALHFEVDLEDKAGYPEGEEGIAAVATTTAWAGLDAVERFANTTVPTLSDIKRLEEAYASGSLTEEQRQHLREMIEQRREGVVMTLINSGAEYTTLIWYGIVSESFLASLQPTEKGVQEALEYLTLNIIPYIDAVNESLRWTVGGNIYEYAPGGFFERVKPGLTTPPGEGGPFILVDIMVNIDMRPFTLLSQSMTSPILVFSMISVVIVLVAVGLKASTEALSMVLADLRPYIALIIARGARTSVIRSNYMMVVLAVAAAVGVAGVMATSYPMVAALNALVARGVLDSGAVASSPLYWATGIGGALLVGFLVSWRTLKLIREIQPVEALRPVESLRAAHKKRARLSALLVALSTIAVAVGLFVRDPESFIEGAANVNPALAALAMILLMIALFFTPFAPAVLSYQAAELLQASVRLYTAIARRLAVVAGPLRAPVEESAGRLRERLAAALASTILASGVAMGAAFAAESIARLSRILEDMYVLGRVDLDVVSGFAGSTGIYYLLAVFALAVAVVVLYTSIASTFRLVEGEIVVMRARGASPGQALRFTYSLLLPIAVYALVSGLVVAGIFWVTVKASSDFLLTVSIYEERVPMLGPAPGSWSLTILLLLLASYLLLPYLVSWRVTRSRDVARLLREVRVGG